MDDFLKIEPEKSEETKIQKGEKENSVDKKRVARLRKSFLPYWARKTELASKTENETNVKR